MLANDSRTKYDTRAAPARCWVRGSSIRLRCNYQDVGSSTPLMGRVTPHLCHLSIAIASPDTAAGGMKVLVQYPCLNARCPGAGC